MIHTVAKEVSVAEKKPVNCVTFPFPSKDPVPGASTGQQGKSEQGGKALGFGNISG